MRVFRALIARLRGRRGAADTPGFTVDTPGLTVVAEAFDDTEAASSVLARASRWDPRRHAVLRHHLVLPAGFVPQARELLAEDGWTLRACEADPHPHPSGIDQETDRFVAVRVQRLDALSCSQEASRMASLLQRMRGRALGWDALQPDDGGR